MQINNKFDGSSLTEVMKIPLDIINLSMKILPGHFPNPIQIITTQVSPIIALLYPININHRKQINMKSPLKKIIIISFHQKLHDSFQNE